MGEMEKKTLGLKILSVLIVIMFVSVATVCPVVRSDDSSAETADEQEEMIPDEILNEYIAEELQAISDMAEEQLMEEYGITMDEYQESMAALGGSTLMLVGDENGNISVEVSESIDRGRAGPWWDGNYFYFGIESCAWSAIKWWFSDDCINMLVDQICQGDIDAVAIAEKELNDTISTLAGIYAELSDINGILETVRTSLTDISALIETSEAKMNAAYDDAIAYAERSYERISSVYNEICDNIEDAEALIKYFDEMSVEDIVNCETNAVFRLAEVLAACEIFKSLSKGLDYTETMKLNGIGKFSNRLIVANTLICIANGDSNGAAYIFRDYIEQRGINYCANKFTEGIDVIKEQLKDEIEDLEIQKKKVKASADDAKKAVEDAKKAKADANTAKENAEVDEKKADKELTRAENKKVDAKNELDSSKDKYEKASKRFTEVENRYNSGMMDKSDYNDELHKFEEAKEDYKLKTAEFEKSETNVHKAAETKYRATEKVTLERENVTKEKKAIEEGKKLIKENKVKSLKNGLKAAKTSAKVAAKATAKASCKTAICATGIGAVIMIALDIVMALLIKFLEDHFQNQGYDTDSDYGVMVKVQVLESYDICIKIKIGWFSYYRCCTITAPCVPRLDGVYMQW